MLRAARRCGGQLPSAAALPAAEPQLLQQRHIRLFEIFDRSKAKERREKLKEETQRGYWDDFKELKDTRGKLFAASQSLQPAQPALSVPDVQVLSPDEARSSFPSLFAGHAATLLCLAFRGGAEEMLASWSRPFGAECSGAGACQHVELSLVESAVMSAWPFRRMILRGRSAEAEAGSLQPRYAFHFGDAAAFVQRLGLSNRLTGYVFLVDRRARVRWRGSGTAAPEEAAALLQCGRQLLQEDGRA